MKAWVLHGVNDLRFEDVETPKLKSGEVLVKVQAAGICGSDIPRIYETGMYSHPLIPGHEFAGEVVQTFDEEYSQFVGKRVGVFPLIPCRTCEACTYGYYEMCKNYNYLGSRCNGGFAEYVAVPVRNIIELPDNVDIKVAAMLEPMSVAIHAIRRAKLNGSEKVAVIGLGTIGLLAIMFLKEIGISNIVAIGNKEFQKEKAKILGVDADSFCNSKIEDANSWLEAKGTDVIFECVGSNDTINMSINGVKRGGRVVVVGNPHSDISFEKKLYWKILRNQITLIGTWNSSFTGEGNDDWHYVLNLLKNNKINSEKLITHEFDFSKLSDGLAIMKNKSEEYGKIIIRI